ncbi:MAG: hypothetical protein U9R03_04075, partial [Candidatus Aerophobetes bacterium]|nr:hypothetical protein [Candidatus Aerophobetes bacterium]
MRKRRITAQIKIPSTHLFLCPLLFIIFYQEDLWKNSYGMRILLGRIPLVSTGTLLPLTEESISRMSPRGKPASRSLRK